MNRSWIFTRAYEYRGGLFRPSLLQATQRPQREKTGDVAFTLVLSGSEYHMAVDFKTRPTGMSLSQRIVVSIDIDST